MFFHSVSRPVSLEWERGFALSLEGYSLIGQSQSPPFPNSKCKQDVIWHIERQMNSNITSECIGCFLQLVSRWCFFPVPHKTKLSKNNTWKFQVLLSYTFYQPERIYLKVGRYARLYRRCSPIVFKVGNENFAECTFKAFISPCTWMFWWEVQSAEAVS